MYRDPHADKELHAYFVKYLRGVGKRLGEDAKVAMVEAIDRIKFAEFPVPNTEYKEFHLSGSSMTKEPGLKSETVGYNYEDFNSFAKFTYKFTERSRPIGLPKAVLYMSTPIAR